MSSSSFSRPSCRSMLLLLSGLMCLVSCNDRSKRAVSTGHLRMTGDSVMNYNRKIVKTEDQEIEDLITRYHWNMKTSPTGLRFMIYQHGNGPKAKEGSRVVYREEVRLTNGTVCYPTGKKVPKEVTLGREEIERGLEEGILMMKVGDRAKFIVPSHLAFGLLGDQNRIPPGATLIYDVELLKVK